MGIGVTEGLRYKVSSSLIKSAMIREIAVWEGDN